jgi:hypothetical protein
MKVSDVHEAPMTDPIFLPCIGFDAFLLGPDNPQGKAFHRPG